ncbi:hypothetical protein [Enterococcus sp. E5-209]|uniref:hypothetical protein n=1 Tax=Enterococcus sp. E5-209 TaxID=3002982 RepID=UPI002D7F19DB|nr:hypothetical protein [Enterococcus sp. E5-209]MEB4756067.1 hypothetical protein [Enterococcus sp. E5-209]
MQLENKKRMILFFYGLFLFCTVLSSSTISLVSPSLGGGLKYLALLFIIFGCFLSLTNIMNRMTIFFLLTLSSFAVVASAFSVNHSPYFIYILLLIVCLMNINYLSIFKACYVSLSIVTFCLIFLSKTSIIPNLTSYRITSEVTSNSKIREALGFMHPNIAAFHLMVLFAMGIFILSVKKDISFKGKLFYIGNALACVLISNFLTNSRTTVLGMVVTLLFLIFSKFFSEKKLGILTVSITVLLILFTILTMTMDSGSSLFNTLNTIFNGRIYSNNRFYLQYGIKFFGNLDVTRDNPTVFNNQLILDNAFARLFIIDGLLDTIFYFFIVSICLIKSVIERNKYVLIFIIITLISMFSESQFIVNYALSFSLILCMADLKDEF